MPFSLSGDNWFSRTVDRLSPNHNDKDTATPSRPHRISFSLNGDNWLNRTLDRLSPNHRGKDSNTNMAKLIDLPDEVLARIFSSLLRTPPECCDFGQRAAPGVLDALALAQVSKHTWRAFGLCLSRVRVNARISNGDIRSLVLAAGGNLRSLTLASTLPSELNSSPGALKLLRTIASECTSLTEFRFDARTLRVAQTAEGSHEITTAFSAIVHRLHTLEAKACAVSDLLTVCDADIDYSGLRALDITVANIFEANHHLSVLWAIVSGQLQHLRVGVVDTNIGIRTEYPVIDDGISGFTTLYERRLDLNSIEFTNLNYRALTAAHLLVTEPTGDNLQSVTLSKCHLWRSMVTRLCENRALKDLRIEDCWMNATDVSTVVRSAAHCLTSLWRNMGHWHGQGQIDALRHCTKLRKLDLGCIYNGAAQDVLELTPQLGCTVEEVRLGGSYFTIDDVLKIIKQMPKLNSLTVSDIKLEMGHVRSILDVLGERTQGFSFDETSSNWHVGELFTLVREKARNIRNLGFPSKMCRTIPVPNLLSESRKDAYRLKLCIQFLEDIQQLPNLDIDSLRNSLIRDVPE